MTESSGQVPLTPPSKPSTVTHVVGVGASAGGLEALEQLFRAMPTATGMAFVVIQHLSPDFKSQMYELVGRWTELEVEVATHQVELEPDTIYLMPPGVDMIVEQGKLLLGQRGRGLSLPIDTFFRSCARDLGERSVAIILSGTGSDGSRGLRDVHEVGGLVIAQSPDTAKFDGMPRSALETGVVDLSLGPAAMPEALVRYTQDLESGPPVRDSAEAVKLGGMRALFSLLEEQYNIDFSAYKPGTVGRRIERRIMLNQHEDLSDYIDRLRRDRSELDALYRDLLIGVTAFFRDPAAFRVLEEEVLPSLLAEVSRGQELRVWVAGCATGEEAYSLAILLAEALAVSKRPVGAKIFATDAHRSSLEVAGAGLYPTAAVAEVGAERLERWFVPEEGGYRVSAELRQMIVFAPHNVIRDAPFTKLHLISCRNMLIYFQPQMQRKVLSLFHFGLRTRGVLFLGPSETPGVIGEEFQALHTHWKLYRKSRDVRLLPTLREPEGAAHLHAAPSRLGPRTRTRETHLLDLFGSLLDDTLPPSVLVDSRHQVTHTFGDISALLRLPRGRPSLSLLDMLGGDFKLAVAGALHRSARVRGPVSFSDVRGVRSHDEANYEIRVRPVELQGTSEPYFLVSLVRGEIEDAQSIPEVPVDLDQASRDRLESLEFELRHTKENLQATIEELEASNEELQATNEELLASNEELQSTNEELHSVNEELYTVNAEFQRKIEELTELTEDMDNLLLSTEVHTLFLDEELAIRKFTPRIAEVFNLVATDLGRRIDSFVHSLELPDLPAIMLGTLETGERVELEASTKAGLRYLVRVLPYRSHGRRGGVVLTLIEVTRLHRAEVALREQVELRDHFLAMLSHELRNPLAATNNALELIERRRREAPGVDALDKPLGMIRRQSHHMQRLLDDLLDVSRVTQGKIHLRKQAVELCAVMGDVVDQRRHQIEERELELRLELCEDPPWIYGDLARVVQIFDNLIGNAIKYTQRGGTIGVLVGREGDGGAIVRVEDNGAGIDAKTQARIFDMFVQADATLERSQGGLGVGLTLVNQLVELHEGTIRVASEGLGKGSEFVIHFPRVAKPVVQVETPNPVEERLAEAQPHLVIVEDRPEIRETLAELLEDSGYRVTAASDGERGLVTVTENRPDAALLDIGLPGIDGYELARRLRDDHRTAKMPLIAMTGYGRADDRIKVQEAGFDLHMVKPVDIDDVIAALERLGVPPGPST